MNAIDLLKGASVELAPLRGLTGGGVTLQAWVRPRAASDKRGLVELGGGPGGERLTLYYGGGARRFVVEVTLGDRTTVAVNRNDVALPDRWVHVTAALAADGACTLYLDGKRAEEGRDPALTADALRPLLTAPVLSRCSLGRGGMVKNPDGKQVNVGSFPGALAEVRVWGRRLSDAEIAGNWQTRARGDESGLLACYRLDGLAGSGVVDLSGSRGHGRASAGATPIADPALPLPATSGASGSLAVRGKLVREWFPLAAFPADRALAPAADKAADRRRANADAYGDITDDRVLCSVYEATVEPRRADGLSSAGAAIQIRVDGPVLAVIDDSEDSSFVAWTPGQEYALAVPPSGKLRLRVLAGEQLDCPTLRLRSPELPEGVWQAARPAELAHRKLLTVKADDLLSPAEGAPSPLPSGTSREDAEALASMLSAVATALPIAEQDEAAASFGPDDDIDDVDEPPMSFGLHKWIKQATRAAERAAEEAARKAAEAAIKTAAADVGDDEGEEVDAAAIADGDMPVSFGFGKWVKKTANKAASGVSDAAKSVGNAASDAARAAEAAARKAAEDAARKAEENARKAAQAAEAARRAAEDAARKAAEETQRAAEAAARAAEEAARKAAEETRKAAEAAARAAEEAARKAAEETRKAAEAAARLAEESARITARLASQGAKEASRFIVRTGKDLVELAEKAARVAPQFGKDAARAAIRGAAQVAVATIKDGQAWRMVQLIGTTIVDGVEQAWRVVVSGVEDALAAVVAFFERVGATIRKVIDYLAKLFSWDRFLAASDKIYDAGLYAFETFGDAMQREAAELFDRIESFLRSPLDTPLADKTFGEALGIDPNKGVPVLDELEYAVDQIQKLFTSKKREVEPTDEVPSGGATISGASASEGVGELVPKESFTGPKAIFNLPMRPLLALPVQAWRLGEPVIRPTFEAIGDTGAGLARAGLSLLKARLYVPWLTKTIEVTLLGGRKLNLLRVISLLGAIPAVLLEAGAEMISSFGDGADNTHVSEHWIRWLTFGSSLLNSIAIVIRAAIEEKATHTNDRMGIAFMLFVNGTLGGIQAGCNVALATKLKGSASLYAGIASGLDCTMAGWYFMYSKYLGEAIMRGDKASEETWVSADSVVEVVLGLATMSTAIAAYVHKDSNDETLGVTLGFRAASWTCRAFQRIADGLDNRTPKMGYVSMALGVVGVAIDVSEGLYYAVKAAEG